ncbi:hypothetical protein KAR91_19505 [Candidatus Pacearchaeota archaeon]|nr:hypothetical protein [Candidatus Pacearchaeota archaeon]
MSYVTSYQVDGQSFEGPRLEVDTFKKAEVAASTLKTEDLKHPAALSNMPEVKVYGVVIKGEGVGRESVAKFK